MKRIRQALNRFARARKPTELITKTSSTETVQGRPSLQFEADDGIGPLVLYDGTGESDDDTGVDIVFVHCFGGGRIRSWQKDDVCWPKDFLPRELPNSRIITWGYKPPAADPTRLEQYAQVATQISERLIADLPKVFKKTTRDIIFVAHGIGGLVVKDALSTIAMADVFGSQTGPDSIYPKTAGIVFLGTPHGGHGRQPISDAVAIAAQIETQSPSDVFHQLVTENNELLETQRDEFMLISRDIHVVCVRELLPLSGMMLPKASAVYEGLNVTVDDIFANHLSMARFASRQDPGYFQLVGHISKLSRRAKLQDTEAKLTRNREILDALHFDMRVKQDPDDAAYSQTCSWLLSAKDSNDPVSGFHNWLQSPGSIFWVSGIAGSGKSTLMKYAFHDEETRRYLEKWADGNQLIMTAIFLFEGGDHVQRSREGILRAILWQILHSRPDLIPICFPSFVGGPWPPPVPFNTAVNLSQAFYQLFARTSRTLRLCIFIDGLNEYRLADREGYSSSSASVTTENDGLNTDIAKSYAEIARLITDLANQEHVKLCVASREVTPFKEAFFEAPRLRVHTQTEKFIAQYCADRLENVAPGMSVGQVALCREVARKSSGDILWARLAMDMLMEGSLKRLKPTLESLPTRLSGQDGLYMHMIQNLTPKQQLTACRIFQIVLRSQNPPSLITVAFAEEGYLAGAKQQEAHPELGELMVSHDRARPFTLKDVEGLTGRMEQRLESYCAGLLEASKDQRVVFMHLTAKEFILDGRVWENVLLTPPNKVEIYFSLISGTLRFLRCFRLLRPLVSKRRRLRFHPEPWLLVANILRYAAHVDDEPFDPKAYCELLDELDRTCNEFWTTAVEEHVPAPGDLSWYEEELPALRSKHWSNFEPMELGDSPKRGDFLSLAVQANLFNYVAVKLGMLEGEARRAKAQELLEYAVCPEGDSRAAAGSSVSACRSHTGSYRDFHHDMPNTRFLALFFGYGADATDENARGVWAQTLTRGRSFFFPQGKELKLTDDSNRSMVHNRRKWVAAIKALLAHGADPQLQVETRGASGTGGSTQMRSAIDVIRDTLDGEQEYATDLVQIEAIIAHRLGRGE